MANYGFVGQKIILIALITTALVPFARYRAGNACLRNECVPRRRTYSRSRKEDPDRKRLRLGRVRPPFQDHWCPYAFRPEIPWHRLQPVEFRKFHRLFAPCLDNPPRP